MNPNKIYTYIGDAIEIHNLICYFIQYTQKYIEIGFAPKVYFPSINQTWVVAEDELV